MRTTTGLPSAAILTVFVAVACGSTSQGRRNDEVSSDLVIPPIGPDAGRPAARPEPAEAVEGRESPTMDARDERVAGRRLRSRAVIMTEIQAAESLLAPMAVSAASRPHLRRRLADAYNELAYTSSGADAVFARDQSIAHYLAVKDDHPTYAQMDEVFYYLALTYELKGEVTTARRCYYDLIKRAPSPKLLALAYFAFGELFYVEAATHPSKNPLAQQAYAEVLKYPPVQNPVYAFTLLRLGQIQLRTGDDTDAQATFDRLRRDFPDSPARTQIPPGR